LLDLCNNYRKWPSSVTAPTYLHKVLFDVKQQQNGMSFEKKM